MCNTYLFRNCIPTHKSALSLLSWIKHALSVHMHIRLFLCLLSLNGRTMYQKIVGLMSKLKYSLSEEDLKKAKEASAALQVKVEARMSMAEKLMQRNIDISKRVFEDKKIQIVNTKCHIADIGPSSL